MRIVIIGTICGVENEGMRNVATHLSRELSQNNEVKEVGLRDVWGSLTGALWADCVLVCAKASGSAFHLLRLIHVFNKNIMMLFVQKPEPIFLEKFNKSSIKIYPLCIDDEDVEELRLDGGYSKIGVGIDSEKFVPVRLEAIDGLKEKYGLKKELPTVVHVGHCSAGRGLEDFLLLTGEAYNRLVYASGMFEDKRVLEMLVENGVKVVSDFNPSIQEVFQLADVYLFPTRNKDYVISVPLSVMEALSCGTPVVAYESMRGVHCIEVNDSNSILYVDDSSQIPFAVTKQIVRKGESSYLSDPRSWKQVSEEVIGIMAERCK